MKIELNHRIATGALLSLSFAFGCEKNDDRDESTRMGTVADESVRASDSVGAPSLGTAARRDVLQGVNAAPAASNIGSSDTTSGLTSDDAREAEAEFKSVPKMKLEGDADLEEVPGGVRVKIEVEGAPTGQKGIHIHQTDDCSDIAHESMGEHFAPAGHKHGLPTAAEHHLGDLGNITIDKDGKGDFEITVMGANLKPNDAMSLVGRAIVIHEGSDKGTGKSGDAGKPIACAPIRAD